MLKFFPILYFFLICLLIASCSPVEEPPVEDDVVLAKVFNKTLYLSELEGMMPTAISREDSINFINAEVERWAREAVLMQEAEKNIPSDLNIDGLVRDYRASLVRHNYEKMWVEMKLDSSITELELNDYYEKNKEQYQLESSIFRCHIIKIPLKAKDLNQLRTLWRSTVEEDMKKMKEYCEQNADYYMLEDTVWLTIDEVRAQLPKGTNIFPNQDLTQSDKEFLYFLKVLEKKSQKEIAPLGYIREQAQKVILHKRKKKLLEAKKEELYEKETRKNNIKIMTN